MEKISVTLALSSLEAKSERVRQLERDLIEARNDRDNDIRDARAARIPYPTLMSKTGLGRDRLIKIAQTPDTRGE